MLLSCLQCMTVLRSLKIKERKPSVHAMYDHTKGGIDVVDFLSISHSTRIKC